MPLRVSSDKMSGIKKEGRDFVTVSGPPAEYGEHRVGWFRDYRDTAGWADFYLRENTNTSIIDCNGELKLSIHQEVEK